MGQPSAAQLRISAAIRIGIAVLVASAITAAAIAVTWGPLDVQTDIVGYPIFYEFNGENYYTAYYLVIGFFPIASLLLFLGLTRIGPRIGLPVPPSRGSLRPSKPAPAAEPALEGDPPLASAAPAKQRVVGAARIAFVGALLGLQAAIATDSVWICLALGVAIYGLGTIVAAAALKRWGPGDWSLDARLAAANAIGVPLTVAGLVAVSASTEVLILADGSVEQYPWFPAWLGVAGAAALIAWIGAGLHRSASAAGASGIERRALILVAAPVALYLVIGGLPGDVGPIDTFHSGEGLVGARLVGDGWLPWRDVVLTHGFLQDVITPAAGLLVFDDSHWGYVAGTTVLTTPLFFVAQYFLFAYLFGRNWLFLLLTSLLVLGTSLAPANFRFVLWPLALLLLAAVLDKPTPLRSAALGVLVVGQTILTPETAPALLATALILVLYELYSRKPSTPLVSGFPRTLWFGAAAIASAAAFAGYLVSQGALDDFVFITRSLTRGHSLTGAHAPSHFDGSLALLNFQALAPVVALLIAFAYAVVRLRLRLPFSTRDWVMGAVAVAAVPYYAKFLARMDLGHVAEVYSVTLPLILFIVFRLAESVDRAVREGFGNLTARLTTHPVSLGFVVMCGVLGGSLITDRVSKAPERYQPSAPSKPEFERVGYAQTDPVLYRDMKRVLDAYLAPDDRLFDFTNSPALFFYLLERDPSTRYFHVTLALREESQEDLIDRLEEARPKLIVFDSTYPGGLPNWDGIPTPVRNYDVSHWILDNYRPLMTTHAHTIYARRDQPPPEQLGLRLAETPLTDDHEFQTQRCNWGYAPNFLSADQPPDGARSVRAQIRRPRKQLVRVVGWAGDALGEAPAPKVFAVHGGRTVASTTPDVIRPELATTGVQAFTRAGYEFSIPADRLRQTPGRQGVRVFATAADGAVGELGKRGVPTGARTARIDGRRVRLDPKAIYGSIDRVRRAPAMEIVRPPGSRWSDFDWLELEPKREFQRGRFFLYDSQTVADLRREISFQTIEGAPSPYVVPVSSCAQWRGYSWRRLYLSLSHHQGIAAVRLIR